VKRKAVYFVAPRQVELREEVLPVLGADDVLVETICSGISTGTEMLIYRGSFPRDFETDSVISSLRGAFAYPLAYGYACVGIIRETGKQVDTPWRDKLVFAFQPHTSHFIAKPESLFPVPESLSPETACFLPNMETAVNLVQDGAPILGEKVLVFGQGVVGLLTASLLNEFPLKSLVTVEQYELRRNAIAVKDGKPLTFDPSQLNQFRIDPNFRGDLTFELSGNPAALNDAIALTAFNGRIVIGSWYGEKRTELNLGGAFHRSRIKLISSQVSTIAPELSGRWDKARRFEVAWDALNRIMPERWITHRFPIGEAEKAYQLLNKNLQETIQVIFDYTL
jgi:2-desacetyl-2-hydroxyethyl bacteriochlorophyllide A dehydrogenase